MTDWRPTATRARLEARARLLARLRAFLTARGVLEVETPIASRAGNPDPAIDSLQVASPGGASRWLATSPEFAMKRLLAAGSGPIFQITRAFRAGERGRYHNPEFTLLEWYRPGLDHHALMDEVAELISALGLPTPVRRNHGAAFAEATGVDPHRASDAVLLELAQEAAGRAAIGADASRGLLLDVVFSHRVAPALGRGRPCLLFDYPAVQCALARVRPGPVPLAERFELFVDGVEIANGYHELTDAGEQRRRFEVEREARRRAGRPSPPLDGALLAALQAGMPEGAGVALGVDRLLMALTGAGHIDEVLAFPWERA